MRGLDPMERIALGMVGSGERAEGEILDAIHRLIAQRRMRLVPNPDGTSVWRCELTELGRLALIVSVPMLPVVP